MDEQNNFFENNTYKKIHTLQCRGAGLHKARECGGNSTFLLIFNMIVSLIQKVPVDIDAFLMIPDPILWAGLADGLRL